MKGQRVERGNFVKKFSLAQAEPCVPFLLPFPSRRLQTLLSRAKSQGEGRLQPDISERYVPERDLVN